MCLKELRLSFFIDFITPYFSEIISLLSEKNNLSSNTASGFFIQWIASAPTMVDMDHASISLEDGSL